MFIHILGRQPALSLAELESRFGAEAVQLVSDTIALVEGEDKTALAHLGGTVKAGMLLATIPTSPWPKLVKDIQARLLEHVSLLPEGKLKLGLSVYGLDIRPQRINASALELKKAIKATGRSVRVVPNQDSTISSAQTLHNQLVGELGFELMVIAHGNSVLLAKAIYVQDIDAYALRDRGRPMRDAFVGMLPPKLAQIIINLALRQQRGGDEYLSSETLLDPFCGTGVVLQEALLMGLHAYGTDLDERMIRYSRDNINWLQDSRQAHFGWYLEQGDATTHTWRQPINFIAGETYLGTPLRELPRPAELDKIIKECDTLHRNFLKNLAPQIISGTQLCLAVPTWRVRKSFRHLPMLDYLSKLGYNRIDFKHVRASDLIYHRENQLVARELVVLTRK